MSKGIEKMYSKKIYQIGLNLGLNKKDIDIVLSSKQEISEEITSTSPVEVYKGVGRYGTVSIYDFK